jgi:LysM repeat protein
VEIRLVAQIRPGGGGQGTRHEAHYPPQRQVVRRAHQETVRSKLSLTILPICASILFMSETLTRSPNIHISKVNKVLAPLTALALVGALGLAIKRGTNSENAFKTDIPVLSESQPHIDYTVRPGDTEGSIAQRFNVSYDSLDYQNMINAQLPKSDQSNRNLQPGEQLNLPPK